MSTKWWKQNGIYVIIFGSIFILFIMWLIYRNNKTYFDDSTFEDPFDPIYLPKSDIKKRKQIKESKGEKICKDVATKLFKKPFIKIRPDCLRNDETGRNMELDVYNDDLKLGIEYNGRQHYEYLPYFHKDYNTFLKQKYRDELKLKKCQENGIQVIIVPYTIKHDHIETFIIKEAKRLGYSF